MKKLKKALSFLTSAVMAFTMMGSSVSVVADYETTTNEKPVGVQATDYSVSGSSSFSSLLSTAFTEEIDNQEIDSRYTILGVDITDNKGTVEYSVLYDCTLTVAIYDETSGKLMTTASAELTAEGEKASLSFNSELMPEYFVVKAFVIDPETMRPLNKAYVSNKYTQAMVELDNLTVDDFEGRVVVNLDNSKKDNFVVFDSDINVFYENFTLSETQDSEGTSIFVVETADNSIKSLKSGDKFAFMGSSDMSETDIGTVASISVSGDTVTIYAAPLTDMVLDDFFDCVKISAKESENISESENPELLGADSDSEDKNIGSLKIEIDDEKNTAKISYNYEKKTDDKVVSGTCGVSVLFDSTGTDIKLNNGILTVTVKIKYEVTLNTTVTIQTPDTWEIPIEKAKIPIAGGLCFELDIKFYLTIQAKLTAEIKLEGTIGFEYDTSKEDVTNLTTTPVIKSDIKVEGTITVGFKIAPKLALIDSKIASVGAEVDISAAIKGKLVLAEATSAKPNEKHACSKCIDGTSTIDGKVSAEVKFLDNAKTTFKRTILHKTFEGPKWYASFTYGDGEFNAECPHKSYKVDITVVDPNGAIVPNAEITYTDKNLGNLSTKENTVKTDVNGKAVIYLCGPEKKGQKSNRTRLSFSAPGYKDRVETVAMKNEATTCVCMMYPSEGRWSKFEYYDGCICAISEDGVLYYGKPTTYYTNSMTKVFDNVADAYPIFGWFNGCVFITSDGDVYEAEIVSQTSNSMTFEFDLKLKNAVELHTNFNSDMYAIDDKNNLYSWDSYGSRSPQLIEHNVKKYNDGYIIKTNGDLLKLREDKIILSNVKYVTRSGGDNKSTWCITNNNELYVQGIYGQRYNPDPIKVMDNVFKISTFDGSVMVVKNDGSVYSFGENSYGQLGTGDNTERYELTKVADNAAAVAVRSKKSIMVTRKSYNNTLYLTGDCHFIELDGEQFKRNNFTEIKVNDQPIDNIKEIVVGLNYFCILKRDGLLYYVNDTAYLIPCPDETDTLSATAIITTSDSEILNATETETELTTEEKTYEGLIPNNIYNVYAMRSRNAENPFGNDNLIFIDQFVSDENGCLTFNYDHPADEVHEVVIKAMSEMESGNAKITSAEAENNNATIAWEAFPNAEKYMVCRYENGLAVPVAETEELTYTINGLEEGTSYGFVVKTFVGGEWSETKLNDYTFVTTTEPGFFDGWTDQDYIDYVNKTTSDGSDFQILDDNQLQAIEYVLSLDYDKAS